MLGELIPIVAIVCTIGLPIVLLFRYKHRKLEVEALKALPPGGIAPAKELAALEAENQRLRARIENLESVVLNVDFELNQRLLRVSEAQSRLLASGGAFTDAAKATKESVPARAVPSPNERVPLPTTAAEDSGSDPSFIQKLAAAPSLHMPLQLRAGTLVAERYRIEAEVGRGGMGVVYRAHDSALGETVALKVIAPHLSNDPQVAERFRREVGAARRVTSPNVVRIHDLGNAGDHLFYSMEWFEGPSLETQLQGGKTLSLAAARRIFLQVCDGLDAAHRAEVIHRDLKPANILVDDVCAKIIDFGLASAAGSAGLTATGLLVGTPAYMAPEQIKNGPQDERTDVYAFGVVLYRALCGVLPFDGKNAIAIGFAHISDPPPPPRQVRPELPAEVEAVILRALAKEPRARFARVRELRAALDSAL